MSYGEGVKKMPKDFTSLEVWQEASELTDKIYKVTGGFPAEERYNLTSQLRRSVVSIAANIAEASGRYHFKDKVNFLFNARGSLEETRSHLFIAGRLSYASSEIVESFDESLVNLRKKLNGLINAWKSNA